MEIHPVTKEAKEHMNKVDGVSILPALFVLLVLLSLNLVALILFMRGNNG